MDTIYRSVRGFLYPIHAFNAGGLYSLSLTVCTITMWTHGLFYFSVFSAGHVWMSNISVGPLRFGALEFEIGDDATQALGVLSATARSFQQ